MEGRPSASPKQKRQVAPQVYNEFIKQIELKWVYLENATVKRHRAPDFDKDFQYVGKEGKRSFESTDDGFRAHYQYTISLNEIGTEEPFAELKCTYAAAYTSNKPMTRDLFAIFKELNLPLNTWPYVREFVHGMTNRMGLPTLVLRSLKR